MQVIVLGLKITELIIRPSSALCNREHQIINEGNWAKFIQALLLRSSLSYTPSLPSEGCETNIGVSWDVCSNAESQAHPSPIKAIFAFYKSIGIHLTRSLCNSQVPQSLRRPCHSIFLGFHLETVGFEPDGLYILCMMTIRIKIQRENKLESSGQDARKQRT